MYRGADVALRTAHLPRTYRLPGETATATGEFPKNLISIIYCDAAAPVASFSSQANSRIFN